MSLNMKSKTVKKTQGFSLIELLIVVAVILILAAAAVPHLMSTVNDISLRYAAADFSGLVQSARIQAVRKNTFYTVQQGVLPSGTPAFYVDLLKTGAYSTGDAAHTNGDPAVPINPSVTVRLGPGSGAPNEAAFLANLAFIVDATGAPPSFSARGLPCIAAANSCPMVAGQGFVVFMSKPAIMGNVPWAAVVINPSGHIQLWTSDVNGNWVQRD